MKKLIVITSYPDKRYGIKKLNAVAWHAQKTLKRLSQTTGIICLAEKTGSTAEEKINKNLTVIRSYKKGSFLTLCETLPHILRHNEISDILIQFEFNIFGGFAPVITLPLFLLILKLLGKNITFEIHQVVQDISVLENHINVHARITQKVFTWSLHGFYRVVGMLSDNVIVLEDHLKQRLSAFIPQQKISVVPLSVSAQKTQSKTRAKQKLGYRKNEFVIVMFGFVNWYKGSDWIVNAVSQMKNKNIRLILAGGKNPTLSGKGYYERFYSNIKKKAALKNIHITGFIEDTDVATYYSAADVIVLPYRVFMSASGPFSLALSYKKPVLLSEELHQYADAYDFDDTMKEAELSDNNLFFQLDRISFEQMITGIMNDKKLYGKLERFAALLAAKRDESRTIRKYEYAIFHKAHLVKQRSLVPSVITPYYEKLS